MRDLGEIAAHHLRGGNRVVARIPEGPDDAARGGDAGALVVAEDEGAVLDDRSAGGRSKLVLDVGTARRAGLVVFPAVGVEVLVLEVLEENAVKLVGARLQADADHAARAAPVLGVDAVGHHAHFADGLDGGTDDERSLVQEVDDVNVVIDAVQQEVVLPVGTDAVGGKAAADRVARAILGGQHAGRKASQKGKRTLAAQREIGRAAAAQVRAECRAFGLQQRGCASNLNGFRYFTDGKGNVDAHTVAADQDYVLLRGPAETLGFRSDRVSARLQGRADVFAGSGGGHVVLQTGRIFGDGDLCVWHRPTLLVGNQANDGAQVALSEGSRRKNQSESRQQ